MLVGRCCLVELVVVVLLQEVVSGAERPVVAEVGLGVAAAAAAVEVQPVVAAVGLVAAVGFVAELAVEP